MPVIRARRGSPSEPAKVNAIDDVRLLLVARSARHRGIGSACVYVREANARRAELAGNGANVQGAPVSQPWGLSEFRVPDIEGSQLTFARPFE